MALEYLKTAVTPAVQAAQRHYYGRAQNFGPADAEARTSLGAEEADFIAARDSFYLATVSETGWPYIQHRGGPAGFLRVLDARTLAFADFKGNRQLLSTGNLAGGNDRASLFLMDYPQRTRLKLMGHVRVIDARAHPALARQVAPDAALLARTERVFVVDVVSFDWNCPQYITPRYTLEPRLWFQMNVAMARRFLSGCSLSRLWRDSSARVGLALEKWFHRKRPV